ncbi:MAG: glycosyltransferase [Lachnospiraceae bacterium]
MLKNITIVLPSLNPDHKLIDVVDGVLAQGFSDIVIVNDGSDEQHMEPFRQLESYPSCTILTHEVNKGKGRALKTAFAYCLANRPDSSGVITIDGDNQHHPEDIVACAKAMLEQKTCVILGVRDFSLPDVPAKSRLGNTLTKTVFRIACGIKISDTQTGLRAIPSCYLKDMLHMDGERFEYETNMLLEMKSRHIPFSEVPIRTIYIEENASSHFHPIRDSIKIYRVIFKFLLSSGASSLLDLGVFFLLVFLFGRLGIHENAAIFIATLGARLISSLFNYKVNQKLVFSSAEKGSLPRYYLLCGIQLCISAAAVSLLSSLFTAGSFLKTVCKAVVDTILFFISFRIQKEWVFKRRKA